MAQLPRGIDPALLLSQVKNTMPWLFAEDAAPELRALPAARTVLALAGAGAGAKAGTPAGVLADLSHLEYFELCVSAHYLTCGTPVPTDVDNQIRFKLWPKSLALEDALAMADLMTRVRAWDYRLVTARWTEGAGDWRGQSVAGHLGEWFTLAAGAYCALGQYRAPEAQATRDRVFAEIADEVRRHSEIFGSLWRANDGLACLKASASLAHNFGDLDRVMDMWELEPRDRLRRDFYKLGAVPLDADRKLRYLGRLWVAGELYKSLIDGGSMSFENHRHFALRKPRALRESPRLLIPTGPFFDEWGRTVARELARADGRPSEHTLEVIEALNHGSDRLPNTVGYRRALKGIAEIHERDIGTLKGTERAAKLPSQKAFERRWGDEAIRLMDEIPSRAS